MEAKDLLGVSLKGFSVKELTEVFKTNDDGRKVESLGFFQSEKIAKGFAQTQVDAAWHKTRKQFVLTDGEIGFVVEDSVEILDDEEGKLEIAKKARAKLSTEEAEALGLNLED